MAMAGTTDPEFRVTFDSNIEWNADCRDLRKPGKGRMLLKPGQYLMEIKVSNAMSVGLAEKLSELKVFPTSFSKYGAGYADMIRSSAAVRAAAVQETKGTVRRMKGEVAYV